MPRTKYTTEERKKIFEMRSLGKTYREIGEKFGVSYNAIYRVTHPEGSRMLSFK